MTLLWSYILINSGEIERMGEAAGDIVQERMADVEAGAAHVTGTTPASTAVRINPTDLDRGYLIKIALLGHSLIPSGGEMRMVAASGPERFRDPGRHRPKGTAQPVIIPFVADEIPAGESLLVPFE